nr:MAG TPA: hypothetical protein [Caudoviricetes sp.]
MNLLLYVINFIFILYFLLFNHINHTPITLKSLFYTVATSMFIFNLVISYKYIVLLFAYNVKFS